MTFVFLDTETTGLNPDVHKVWEIAYAVGDGQIQSSVVEHSLHGSDPKALEIGRYFERKGPRGLLHNIHAYGFENRLRHDVFTDVRESPYRPDSDEVEYVKTARTLVGANPAFDAAFLRRRWGAANLPWAYRMLDVETYAMAILNLRHVPGLTEICDTLRIPAGDHTAAGDVASVRNAYNTLRDMAKYRAQRALLGP